MEVTNTSQQVLSLNTKSRGCEKYFSNCDLYVLNELFKCDEAVQLLAKEVESLSFDYSVNDLHSVSQTPDLVSISDSLPPLVGQLVRLMLTQVRTVIEDLFHVETKEKITITASKYNNGDYLLCHDDLCEDRQIAFVYYLSDQWMDSDGGALRFFNLNGNDEPINDEYRLTLLPTFNSLVAFRVSDSSYHEVQQVCSDKSRISINGWYHCNTVNEFVENKKQPSIFTKAPLLHFQKYCYDVDIDDVLQPMYLTMKTLKDLSKALQPKTVVLAGSFIQNSLYEACLSELQGEVPWTMKGPPNHRKYEVVEVEVKESRVQVPKNLPHLKELLYFLVSRVWLYYLEKLTNLEFSVLFEENVPPVCMIEIQRWKEGCYSLLADNDFQKKYPTLEVTLFFGVNNKVLGDEKCPLKGSADISGHIVQSVIENHSSSYFKTLARIKRQRLEDQLQGCKVKLNSLGPKSKRDRVPSSGSLPNKNLSRSHRTIKRLVKNKIAKIKQYRRRKVEIEENNILVPMDNAMLFTINSDSAVKFTSYIRQSELGSEPKTCYYAVTVTYLVTSATPCKDN